MRGVVSLFGLVLTVLVSACAPGPKRAQDADAVLVPARNAHFHHDTLALTWQPGFCATGSRCVADQPHDVLIGLHGLWASEPESLIARGVPVQEWWRRGCDLLETVPADAPTLPAPLAASLAANVPHVSPPLVPHEYAKHAACFGYAPEPFFAEALRLRDRFNASPLARWLTKRRGTVVSHAALLSAFEEATFTPVLAPPVARALQLQCGFDASGRVMLAQLWFTLSPQALARFPAAGSYLPAPEAQDNCPAQFLLPAWQERGAPRL